MNLRSVRKLERHPLERHAALFHDNFIIFNPCIILGMLALFYPNYTYENMGAQTDTGRLTMTGSSSSCQFSITFTFKIRSRNDYCFMAKGMGPNLLPGECLC